jgi:alanine-glyoxylate transaminase/serine-glyoxylate transaminase/serine-pyruvate transaminase
MIPGPVEFDPEVLNAMSTPATSHVAPNFIESFGKTIELLRKVFIAPTCQPFVLAGSGTLTWDMTASNLIEAGEEALVVNTGVFGDWFGNCIEVYGGKVTHVRTSFGDCPSLKQIEDVLAEAVNSNYPFKIITLTHVDTSSGVLVDVKSVSEMVKKVSPTTLIVVDGVCSIAAEVLRMEEWGVDVAITASQKALGVPPGLAVMVASQRALDIAATRKSSPSTYFGSFGKWLPIMKKYESRQPCYFATPPVQLILALEVSLSQFINKSGGMEGRFTRHSEISKMVKDSLESWGLKIVPVRRDIAANTLTAVYYPPGIGATQLLTKISEKGVILAGGLHPDHGAKYFRIGHMNVSAVDEEKLHHVETTLKVIKEALLECGHKL